jgi:hypothetical protein
MLKLSIPRILICSALSISLSLGEDIVISEFLASNISGLTDEDGENSDWIELENVSGAAVLLSGWSLTDDQTELNRWVFPAVTLGPGDQLVVFASGKDRAV